MVEQLQKEIDQERQMFKAKKHEYNQNIQFAKNKIETCKEQNQQLKELLTKTREEK